MSSVEQAEIARLALSDNLYTHLIPGTDHSEITSSKSYIDLLTQADNSSLVPASTGHARSKSVNSVSVNRDNHMAPLPPAPVNPATLTSVSPLGAISNLETSTASSSISPLAPIPSLPARKYSFELPLSSPDEIFRQPQNSGK
jgi:hypothetical protein